MVPKVSTQVKQVLIVELPDLVLFFFTRFPLKSIRIEMQMSPETVTNWVHFCRLVCFDCVLEDWSFKPIGGPGIEVEIDESKFSRMKYGQGKAQKSDDWVFGEVERGNGANRFLEVVARRNAATLIPLIQKWIVPGTIIYSDA